MWVQTGSGWRAGWVQFWIQSAGTASTGWRIFLELIHWYACQTRRTGLGQECIEGNGRGTLTYLEVGHRLFMAHCLLWGRVWIACRWLNRFATTLIGDTPWLRASFQVLPVAGSLHWRRWSLFSEQGELAWNLWDRGTRCFFCWLQLCLVRSF